MASILHFTVEEIYRDYSRTGSVMLSDEEMERFKQYLRDTDGETSLYTSDLEICCFAEGTWLRLAGTVVLDDRFEAKKSMLDAYPNLRGMYSEDDGNTACFYFKDATATFASFSAPPKEIKF